MSTAQQLGMAIRDTVTSLGCFGLAFYASWKLTLIMLSSIPITAILMPLFSSRIQPNIQRQATYLSAAAKHVMNAFSIIDTVKCYNGHLQEQHRYSHSLNQATTYYFRQVNWHALQSSVLRFITLGMFVQGFWYGSTLTENDMESAGTVFTAFWSCLIATSSLMQIMPHMIEFEKGKVAGNQLRAIIAAPSKPLASSLRQSRSYAHDINFRNVKTLKNFPVFC
jgi:ATP-binding cassette subfamily B (MDR/TAP) protein 1